MAETIDEQTARLADLSGQELADVMNLGVRDALIAHRDRGESIVIWRDGQVVEVPAAEIEIPEPVAADPHP